MLRTGVVSPRFYWFPFVSIIQTITKTIRETVINNIEFVGGSGEVKSVWDVRIERFYLQLAGLDIFRICRFGFVYTIGEAGVDGQETLNRWHFRGKIEPIYRHDEMAFVFCFFFLSSFGKSGGVFERNTNGGSI